MTRSLLRPARFDDLGLKRALSDRLLPLLVAAMAFLAALALGGAVAASALARQWQEGAGSMLTVQVPQPRGPAADGRAGQPGRIVLLVVVDEWYRWIFAAGAVFLPFFAVVAANAVKPRVVGRVRPVVPTVDDTRHLTSGPDESATDR